MRILLLASLCLFAMQARGGFTYTFELDDTTVGVGQTISTNLYFVQRDADLSEASGFMTSVRSLRFGVTSASDAIADITFAAANPVFDDGNSGSQASTSPFGNGFEYTNTNFFNPVATDPVSTGVNRILAGTISFTGASVGVTQFDFVDVGVGSEISVALSGTTGFTTLDSAAFPGSVSITAVPEPSSLALVGMASACAAGYWRKKKAKKAEATAI